MILSCSNICKSFGENDILKQVSFHIEDHEKAAIVGINGAGKSTLLKVLIGKLNADDGVVTWAKGASIGYLAQHQDLEGAETIYDALLEVKKPVIQMEARIRSLELEMKSASGDELETKLSEYSRLNHEFEMADGYSYQSEITGVLKGLGFTEDEFSKPITALSGGQKTRVSLGKLLLTKPDILLLDEPTNHLDLEMTEWLEGYLSRANISILMVTHDRYFLDRVCSEIIEIDRKQIYQYKGNYSYYLEKRQERMDALNAEVDRASNLLRKELDWMRRQPQARGTKAKYRIDAFYELEKKAKQQHEAGNVNLDVKASYIGSKIFEAEHVSKSFGDLKIVEDFNYVFARYEKMGIVGNNGTGKSTFIKMLMGEVEPDSGRFDVGETVRFGYYSQDGLQFDEQMKVIDVVQNIAEYVDLGDGKKMGVSQFLNYFLFAPEKQHNYVYKLSGGEKRRLYLCTVLMRSPNFLVLDEPTNDLDIVTLNVLEEYLRNFKGCAIVVSHDRYFMDKVVDHLLVFRGNADIKDFPGNYTQYREWKEVQDQLEKEAEAARQAKMASAVEKTPRPEKEQKKKLTFKERKEFEALEVEIPQLEAEKAELETAMSSGTLSNDELLAKSGRIAKVIEAIDEKTMRWLELSELA